MSKEYDEYLQEHRSNLCFGLEWLKQNLPEVLEGAYNIDWLVQNAHDHSKYGSEEYNAYDTYFYTNIKSYRVQQDFQLAWLHHIHHNPHHWQHWVLVNDDPAEGTVCLDMPRCYIIEMICDWWSFSWAKNDLTEIFRWYDEHRERMLLAKNTREAVEDILYKMAEKLDCQGELWHHGIKGQKWGQRNGPPYPLDDGDKSVAERKAEIDKSGTAERNSIVDDAIQSGKISTKINREKQIRHTLNEHKEGRSYIHGDLDYAQKLVDELSGTGSLIMVKGNHWTNQERVRAQTIIGTHVNHESGEETETKNAVIVYSKTGTHIYPGKEKNDGVK